MKRQIAFAALTCALAGLGACGSTAPDPSKGIPEDLRIAEGAFRADEIYGVRHIASGAVCPGLIDQVPRIRASIVSDEGPRYDWCEYILKKSPERFDVRIESKQGETVEAGLAELKNMKVKDAGWSEVAANFPDRQTTGFTYAKAGEVSHGVWLTRAGAWRVSIMADYPEARRTEVLAAIDDFFRKQRAR